MRYVVEEEATGEILDLGSFLVWPPSKEFYDGLVDSLDVEKGTKLVIRIGDDEGPLWLTVKGIR